MVTEIIYPALSVVLLTLVVGAAGFGRYAAPVRRSQAEIHQLTCYVDSLPGCKKENLEKIHRQMSMELREEGLTEAWRRFRQDAAVLMEGDLVPEPEAYFGYDDLIALPRGEKQMRALWAALLTLSGLAFCVSAALGGLLDPTGSLLVYGVGVGFAAGGAAALLLLLFYAAFARLRARGMALTRRLSQSLALALPVGSRAAQTGLLLEGARRSAESIEKVTSELREVLEGFVVEGVAPQVAEIFDLSLKEHLFPSINRMEETWYRLSEYVVKNQQENMQTLANAFADRLSGTVEQRIRAMGEELEQTGRAMNEIRKGLQESAGALQSGLESDRRLMEEVTRQLRQVAEAQQEAAEHVRGLSRHLERTEQLAATLSQWDGLIERSAAEISDALRTAVVSNEETARKLADTMSSLANAGSEQYDKAAEAAAKLLGDVVTEMNRAMDGVGHEIAESITRASADSVAIIDRLTERTALLKEEYDEYFKRVEKMNQSSLDEMDFHMQSVIGRFSEDAAGIMDKLEGNISRAMELFEGNTANMLASLDEQSRSIGLYAHDLNIDINQLSVNLKESVQLFSDQLHNGVERTFRDFDEGLAEVSRRMANTVESIRESVEHLPRALNREHEGR